MKENKFHLSTLFTLEKSAGDDTKEESIKIVGYANTVTKDRYGDVIPSDAWTKGGLKNYQRNPILLAFHNHSKPAGKVTTLLVDEKGLKIEAEVSPSSEVYNFVKEGILKAFSIGASITDAQYDSETDTFIIKDLELLEVSVVSVPANQDSLFSLSKSFDSDETFEEFKKQFLPKEDEVKKLSDATGKTKDNSDMNEEQLAALAKSIADATVKAQSDAAEKLASERAAIDKAAITMTDNTQKLVDEITKRFEDRMNAKDLEVSKTIDGLQGAIKEKAAEMEALMKSKMTFSNPSAKDTVTYKEKETAYFLSKIMGKSIASTKYGHGIMTKASGTYTHTATMPDGSEWETEISNNILNDLRQQLIMAPLFRNINMPLSVMRFPVNPEAGYANWVAKTDYSTTASTGTAGTHQLDNITLSTYKLATKEFVSMEEEEDTILPLVPIIRDAIVRRMAKAHDKALLRGAGSGSDPIKGIATYGVTNQVTVSNSAMVTVATQLVALRRKLGVWGLDPNDLKFIVSQDVYYDLLEDANFQTADKVGVDRATLLKGQIGTVLGIPVIMSAEFDSTAKADTTDGTIAATCVYTPNFLHGEQRGLTLESEYRIEQQSKLLVATRRLAFAQISDANGLGVASLTWQEP